MLTIEFEVRFEQMPETARNEIEQWIDDLHDKGIQRCQEIDDELHRRLEVTTAVLNTIYPVTWKQRQTADSVIRRDVEHKLDEIEAKAGPTTGCIEGCPEEVPATVQLKDSPAEGDGFESCSDEAVSEHP